MEDYNDLYEIVQVLENLVSLHRIREIKDIAQKDMHKLVALCIKNTPPYSKLCCVVDVNNSEIVVDLLETALTSKNQNSDSKLINCLKENAIAWYSPDIEKMLEGVVEQYEIDMSSLDEDDDCEFQRAVGI